MREGQMFYTASFCLALGDSAQSTPTAAAAAGRPCEIHR